MLRECVCMSIDASIHAPCTVAVVPGKKTNFVLGFIFKLIFRTVKYAQTREKNALRIGPRRSADVSGYE